MIIMSNALGDTRSTMDDDGDAKNVETDETEEMDTDTEGDDDDDDGEERDDENDDQDGFMNQEITFLDDAALDALRNNNNVDDAGAGERHGCVRVQRVDLTGRDSIDLGEEGGGGGDGAADEGIDALCDALSHNSTVEELVLDGVGMGLRGVGALADLLEVSRTITEVHLSRDQIGDEDVSILADAVAFNESVISLDLRDNGFAAEGALALAAAVGRNGGRLSYVTIVDNDLGDKGAEAFALYGLLGGDEGGEAFAALHNGLLERPAPLRGLSLMRCNVGDRGAVAISDALQRRASGPASLTTLCLASNCVGDAGAEALAEAIKFDRHLTDLSLENNKFGSRGIKELAWALLLNTTLRSARIRPSEHDSENIRDGWHFLEAVARHISDDSFDEEEVQSFVASLFGGTWRSPPTASEVAIAQRNLEGGGFDRPFAIEGTAALDKRSPRKGQKRLLQALCRAGQKCLGQYPALISE